jgi:hypothetical protein
MSFNASKYLGVQKKKRTLKDKMRIKNYVCKKKIGKLFNKIKNILFFILNHITYRNVLTTLLLLTLWATLFIIHNAIIINANQDRYEIKHNGGLTLLLDKKTGLVWRNVYNNNKERIPSDWDLMDYLGSVVPEGEQEARNKRIENIFKEAKYNVKKASQRKSLLDGYKGK